MGALLLHSFIKSKKMRATQFVAFLVFAMMMSMVRSKPHCPGGWSLFFRERICYKHFRGLRTYEAARSLCKEQGGSMAEVAIASNIGRNNFIAFVFTDQNIWLGGRRVNRGKTFRWDDGQSFSYTNWKSNEPNNAGPGVEDCIVTNWYNNGEGRWNDWSCNKAAETVCQVAPH